MKFLLLSVPVLDLQYPPSSPAIIKSCLASAGHDAIVFDTNILLYTLAGSDQRFVELSNLFEVCGVNEQWENYTQALFDTEHEIIQEWLYKITERIQQEQPDWLGISVFSYKSHKAALLISLTAKKLLPDLNSLTNLLGPPSINAAPTRRRRI